MTANKEQMQSGGERIEYFTCDFCGDTGPHGLNGHTCDSLELLEIVASLKAENRRLRAEVERENETTLQSLMDQLTLKGYYVTLDAHPGGVLEAILLGEHERIKSEEETDMFNSIAEALEWCVARVNQANPTAEGGEG